MRKFHCVELFLEAMPQKSAAHACDASLLTLTISMKIWGFLDPQFSGRKVPHPWHLPMEPTNDLLEIYHRTFTPLHHEISELDIATFQKVHTGNTWKIPAANHQCDLVSTKNFKRHLSTKIQFVKSGPKLHETHLTIDFV